MGAREWLGNKLFKIDKVVERKVMESLGKYNINESDSLLQYRMAENVAWAKGNADVLLEFYKTKSKPATFDTSRLSFWTWVGGKDVPKLHYPAAESLLNSMKSLLFGVEPDVGFVSVEDKHKKEVELLNNRLEKILKQNNINEFYQNGAVMESYSGTIAAKFIIDKTVSEAPIIQLYPQERIDLTIRYNRVIEIIFKDYYKKDRKTYTLRSIYGYGYIRYILVDDKNKEVPLATIEELSELEDVKFSKKILMATYKKNRTVNVEFPDSGFGGSDFEGVIDLFHQIDEIYSTMALYIRRTRPTLTINEMLLPKTADGKNTIIPKEYEFDIIPLKQTDSAAQVGDYFNRNVPKVELETYTTAIKELQRAIYQKVGYSGVTANLDTVGANMSGVALTELEKATLILYQNKVKLWESFLQNTFRLALVYDDIIKLGSITTDYEEYDLNVVFADYHSNTLEDRIKIFASAYQNNQVDIETMLYEIWKELKEEDQIKKMVKNVKIENGIPLLQEQVGDDGE